MEETLNAANNRENTFGRMVADFLRRFTPQEQDLVTSKIMLLLLEEEEMVMAARASEEM